MEGEPVMKVFGYQFDSEELIELKEVSFETNIEEIDIIINFFQHVKDQHSKAFGKTELCHSHFRDWYTEWKAGTADVIVVTTFTGE
jgi:hypothetical protein